MLYPVIDATTVKRTRQFIKRHYANDLVMLPDGRRVPVEFPKPLASSITYDLETILPGFMAELEIALDPPDGSLPLLTLARYQPENYPAGQAPSTLDTAIVGLIRSGLLKRFESSVHAFACTTQKMAREHELFLKASVGVEVTPIERGAEGQQSFTETREEIERLRQNDASIYERGGTVSSAQTGEEYRQELRKALMKRGDEIRSLPWKAGSGMAKGNRRRHLFCATVGKRVYLRFVPLDGGDLVTEIGTCLRLIECLEETPLVMPLDLKQTAFGAWQRARDNILHAWTYETDPANLQPRVPTLNRAVAEHIRQYQPTGIDQQRLARCLEAVEAPCSIREQKLLRTVFEKDFPSADAKSLALMEEIERIGLEPFHAPEPLPPIQPEDVHLICWMAIESA